MIITIQLDVAPFDEEAIESRAKQWRQLQIEDLCSDYGFPASCSDSHCDLKVSEWIDDKETSWEGCLRGLYEHLEALEKDWESGEYSDDLYNSFNEPTEPYEY